MTRGVVELRYDGSFLDDGKPVPANRIGAINGELFSSANGLAFYAAGRLWGQAEYDDIDPVMHSIGSDQLLCADPGSREVRRFLVGLRDRKIWIPGGRAMPPPAPDHVAAHPDGWRGSAAEVVVYTQR